MNWSDIACIVFVCVTANHLGLIVAIERVTGRDLPVINCPKCLSFWVTMGYCGLNGGYGLLAMLAVSFLASYIAIWLELIEGFIDTLYLKLYEKIYATTDNTAAADADDGDSAGAVSEL